MLYTRLPSLTVILQTHAGADALAGDMPVSLRVGGKDFTMDSRVHVTILAVGARRRYCALLVQIDGLDPEGRSRQTAFSQFDEQGRLRVLFHAGHDAWLAEQAMFYYRQHAQLLD